MHPHVLPRPRRARLLTRRFERSHLERQLLATAYECACPIARHALTSSHPTPARSQATPSRVAGRAAAGG